MISAFSISEETYICSKPWRNPRERQSYQWRRASTATHGIAVAAEWRRALAMALSTSSTPMKMSIQISLALSNGR